MTSEPPTTRPVGAAGPSANYRGSRLVILTLVLVPCLFNAIALFPEVQHITPASNDQVFHYLMIERADEAISSGHNPVDHWLPELELGFPEFFYYQNLPHLIIVGLYRLLLKQISLIRLLNLVRYLLMVTIPLTVYWSMRRMEFSPIAAATGAAISSMLSCRLDFSFDFRSYIWHGFGMFPQLCAMHLIFIATACARRVMKHGRGFTSAILTSSALALSDLLYAYMFGIVIALLCLSSIYQGLSSGEGLRNSLLGMVRPLAAATVVAIGAALITAYQIVPMLAHIQYVNVTYPLSFHGHVMATVVPPDLAPPLAQAKALDLAFAPGSEQLRIVFSGHLFDNNRLPIVTGLIVLGFLYGMLTRSEEALIALLIFGAWAFLLVPSPMRDLIAIHLPLVHVLPFFRFVSGVDFGAILIAGLGGELVWQWCRPRLPRIRILVAVALLSMLYAPMLLERWNFYRPEGEGMELTDQAIENDQDLPQIFAALKKLPPGRVYAGTRGNWGAWMRLGEIHLYDLLPIERFVTVMPWQTVSLNAPLLWELDVPTLPICRLFNIRYVIAPPSVTLPEFYRVILSTSRYILYQVDSGGYMQLGRVTRIEAMGSSDQLFASNNDWLASADPAHGKFLAFLTSTERSPADMSALVDPSSAAKRPDQAGSISEETVSPDSLSADVTTAASAVLVIKMTYHPNWHVIVDGHEQRTFMVSPSLIGTLITPGHHEVTAEYQSSSLKNRLLILAGLTLLAIIAIPRVSRIVVLNKL
jgi:membrane protein YfhO